MDLRRARSRLHLLIRRVNAPIADVVADGFIEQHGILGHDAQLAAQRVLGDGGDVLVVNADLPILDVEEAVQEAEDGGLAYGRAWAGG